MRILIAENKIGDAIETLGIINTSDDYADEILQHSSRLNELEKNGRLGVISYSEKDQSMNQIRKALVELIREMEGSNGSDKEIIKPKRKVLVHFFDTDFRTPVLKMLIKYQNHIQDLFDFKISDWETFGLKDLKEKEIRSYVAKLAEEETANTYDLLLMAVDEIIKAIEELPQTEIDEINLVLTSQKSLQTFYSWNTKNRKGIVISIGRILEVFNDEDFNKIVLMIIRVIQRMLIYSMRFPELKAHDNNKHCVMHMSRYIPDLEQSIGVNYLCKNCRSIISESEDGAYYLEKINQWMEHAIVIE